jgi:hypothetical protein
MELAKSVTVSWETPVEIPPLLGSVIRMREVSELQRRQVQGSACRHEKAVGQRDVETLTHMRPFSQFTEVVQVTFFPDDPVEAFSQPPQAIQSKGHGWPKTVYPESTDCFHAATTSSFGIGFELSEFSILKK